MSFIWLGIRLISPSHHDNVDASAMVMGGWDEFANGSGVAYGGNRR